jgi:transketolase C-terminal domain/subunit
LVQNSDVRLSAIRALIGLYADENNYVTLDVFTQRFKGRILQCTLDTETSVSLAAIELATKLAE